MEERSQGDPRAVQVRELVLELLRPSAQGASSSLPEGDALDHAIAGLRALVKESETRRPAATAEQRLNQLLEMIVALVSFDYDKRVPISEEDDIYDHFASGLNMLAEE